MEESLELWRPVAGYEGWYEVSSKGRVRSLDRIGKGQGSQARFYKGRILAQRKNQKGYLFVELWKNAERSRPQVAHIVARAFIGERPEGLLVLHGPNGKLDNSVLNLSYGTHKENNLDRLRDGTMPLGETHFKAKLTEDDIRIIFALDFLGWHKKNIAKLFNTTYQNIHVILIGNTWKHVILH